MKLPSNFKRFFLFLFADVVLLSLALYGALLLRFDANIPQHHLSDLWIYILVIMGVKTPVFCALGLYSMSWPYVSFNDLIRIFKATTVSSVILGAIFIILQNQSSPDLLPTSILIVDYILTLFGIGGIRSAKRIYSGLLTGISNRGQRMIIIGAGASGEQIVRSMLQESRSQYLPIGFVDDDPSKIGVTIHGVRILGNRAQIPQLINKHKVQQMLIAMPSVPSQVIKDTVDLGRKAGLNQIKILPGFHDLVTGSISLSDIREVQLEDLLGREPAKIQIDQIEGYLTSKTILVTGAAGSIGAELCHQIAKFNPQRLIAVDQNETGLFHIENSLLQKSPDLDVETIVADIRDKPRIQGVLFQSRPQVVFHAAAYKHVPMMELHPEEAVKNNVLGTLSVAEAAQKCQVERFVLISTDKAVSPTSVMGVTKRVAEILVQTLNGHSNTKFTAVRFGNVLGSSGSVIPIFQDQIRRGAPVTVTHKDMRRYFMITSEAVLLVLQAAAIGSGGEIFVLDMGKPVRIVELAREMIRLSGLEPDKDLPIVFTGTRPGEKLFEETMTDEEDTVATQHQQIFITKTSSQFSIQDLNMFMSRLNQAIQKHPKEEIIGLLQEIVPGYHNSYEIE